MYIDTVTGDYPLTADEIKERFPNTLFAHPFVPPSGYAEVEQTPHPDWNPVIEQVVEGVPELSGNVWKRTWVIEKLFNTPQEEAAAIAAHEEKALAAWREEASCTPFQGRQSLRNAGLFTQIEAYMALPTTPDIAKDAWEYAGEWRRTSDTFVSLMSAFGVTDTQADELIKAAQQIKG